MTTFTSDDREEEYKKIVAAAPFQPGYEDAVPIPFAGWVNTSPPHIVDSGASVMKLSALKLADELEEFSGNGAFKYYLEIATMLRQQQAEIEALKQIIDANNLIQNIGQFVKPQEKCPSASWWKGDPTCGGLTENYGLGKAQEK